MKEAPASTSKIEQLFQRYKAILEAAGEGIYGLDVEGRTTFANTAAKRLTGWDTHEIIGRVQHDLVHHTHSDGSTYHRSQCPIYATLQSGVTHKGNEIFWRKDGTSFPVAYTSAPLRDEKGNINGAVVTFSDQTTHLMERRYQALIDATSDYFWICDKHGAIRDIHGKWLELVGLSKSEVLGWGWSNALHPQDRERYLAERVRHIGRGEPYSMEVRLVCTDGQVRWFNNRVVPVKDRNGQILEWIGAAREITDRKAREEALKRHATHDQLTHALNRWSFEELLAHNVDKAQQTRADFSLILFDVDHFKAVNDTYGHDVGDQVLKAIVSVAGASIRKEDSLARWGGEEFMILLPDTHLSQARALATRVKEEIDRHEFPGPRRLTISAGVAEYDRMETQEEFVRRIDQALYAAKRSGRNQIVCATCLAYKGVSNA